MILLCVLRKPGALIKVVVLSFVATQISLQNELHHVFTKRVVLRGLRPQVLHLRAISDFGMNAVKGFSSLKASFFCRLVI